MKEETSAETIDQPAETARSGIAWASWLEWKERCAAELCAPLAREQLESFVAAHFHRRVQAGLQRTNLHGHRVALPAAECLQRFESSMEIHRDGRGKGYKDWLFARANGEQAHAAVEGGVVLLIRDIARDYLRREHSPAFMISLNEVCAGADYGLTLEDLIPGFVDPADETAQRELEQLAGWHAQRWAGALAPRERVALLARELGLSLAHPEVERAAGCRKSVLHDSHQKLCERVSTHLENEYSNEDRLTLKWLTLQTLTALSSLACDQARQDPSCQILLRLAEGS